MVLFLFVVICWILISTACAKAFWATCRSPRASAAHDRTRDGGRAVARFPDLRTAARAAGAQHRRHQGTGLLIFTRYIYGFEIAAVILLVAIIAAVALTLAQAQGYQAIDPGVAVRASATTACASSDDRGRPAGAGRPHRPPRPRRKPVAATEAPRRKMTYRSRTTWSWRMLFAILDRRDLPEPEKHHHLC